MRRVPLLPVSNAFALVVGLLAAAERCARRDAMERVTALAYEEIAARSQ